MTMRYAAVMPETLRREFDQAFTAIDDEHRITAQVHVVLSPEAHLGATTAWRESLWVDIGIGWCVEGYARTVLALRMTARSSRNRFSQNSTTLGSCAN